MRMFGGATERSRSIASRAPTLLHAGLVQTRISGIVVTVTGFASAAAALALEKATSAASHPRVAHI